MSSARQMVDVKNELIRYDHEVVLPKNTEQYAEKILVEENSNESTLHKIERNLIRDYYEKIKDSDAVLIVNVDKKGIHNYIGGNAFLEMGFGHVLNKKIFILNDIPDMIYTDELRAMQPIVLNGDMTLMK
jgi:predicted RNA-binding protein with PUA domain